MSTNNPMTKEQLDAIRERLDCGTPTTSDVRALLAEVGRLSQCDEDLEYVAAQARKATERLRALTTVDDAKIERVARNLANLEPGEAWPTTRELGGDPRSVRDEEYRAAMREWAQQVIKMALGADEDEW